MFREAAQVLLTLLRTISMKRALAVSEKDRLNFFTLYDGCLMDVAVLAWCKLFGNRRSEKIHWSRLFPQETSAIRCALESDLIAAAGGDLEELSRAILTYRDTYVAHHDLDQSKRAVTHPSLDRLQETGRVLYSFVYDALRQSGAEIGLPSRAVVTNESLKRIENDWGKIANAARVATAQFTGP